MRWALALLLTAAVAWADGTSTTIMWAPERVVIATNSSWPGTDVLRCTSWVPALSMSNITRMAWFVTGGLGGGGKCSFSVYNDDATHTIRATSGNVACATTNTQEATSLTPVSFSLVSGTKYWLCTCANTNGGSYLAADAGLSSGITTLQNTLAVPIGAMGTNNCIDAAAPATLGTLSAASINTPVVVFATPIVTTTTGAPTTTTTSSTTTSTAPASTTTTTLLTNIACTVLDQGQAPPSTVINTNSFTPTANRLRLAVIASRASSGAGQSPTSVTGNGSTWVRVFSVQDQPTGYAIQAYRCRDASPSAGQVTFTFSTTRRSSYWAIVECSGINTGGVNGDGAVKQEESDGGVPNASGVSGSGVINSSSTPNPFVAFPDVRDRPFSVWFGATSATATPTNGGTELVEQNNAGETSDMEVQIGPQGQNIAGFTWSSGTPVWGGFAFEIVNQ